MLSCYSSTALEGRRYIHSHFSLLPFPLPEKERKANTLGPPPDPTHLHTSLARGTPSSVHKVFTPLLSFTSHSSCASLTKSSGSFLCSRGMSSGGGMPLWCNLGQGTIRDHLLCRRSRDVLVTSMLEDTGFQAWQHDLGTGVKTFSRRKC